MMKNLGVCQTQISYFRSCVAILLLLDLFERLRVYDTFYHNDGIWPAYLVIERLSPSDFHLFLCPHLWFNGIICQQLLYFQIILALFLLLGFLPTVVASASFFMYVSLILRNTWLSYIFDRYMLLFLLYTSVLSCQIQSTKKSRRPKLHSLTVYLFFIQIAWIYFDAGYGKLLDPDKGWDFNAQPISALDTYMRHTVFARWFYRLLRVVGNDTDIYFRYLTVSSVMLELFVVPICILCKILKTPRWIRMMTSLLLPSLHLGIGLCMNNTALLSAIASCAFILFYPFGNYDDSEYNDESSKTCQESKARYFYFYKSDVIMVSFSLACIYFEVSSSGAFCFEKAKVTEAVTETSSQVSSMIFNNRWNVFTGAEQYVTWEIAPGKLADGDIVDIWRSGLTPVSWTIPKPENEDNNINYFIGIVNDNINTILGRDCSSIGSVNQTCADTAGLQGLSKSRTINVGRWRLIPYLAASEGDFEMGNLIWQHLCSRWNSYGKMKEIHHYLQKNHTRMSGYQNSTEIDMEIEEIFNAKRLMRYKMYMLQADILPNLTFTAARKRTIISYECEYPSVIT